MTVLLNQSFTGISIGAVLLLIALGLSLTFGQMGVINMAHGEFIMAGAYTVYLLQGPLGSPGLSLLAALPVAFLVAGAMGALLEWLLIRRLYARPLDTLLVTWGVSLLLQQLARDLFGAPNVQTEAPGWLTGRVTLAGGDDPLTLPYSRLFILGLAVAAVAAVTLTLRRTPLGRRIRAVVQHRELAEASGVPTARVDRMTFFLGSGLAGIAGVSVALIGQVGSQTGTGYVIDAFLVVIVGGLGKLKGTIIAALALGLLNSFSEYYSSASLGKAIVFIAVIVFLQFRPNGIVSFKSRGLTA